MPVMTFWRREFQNPDNSTCSIVTVLTVIPKGMNMFFASANYTVRAAVNQSTGV